MAGILAWAADVVGGADDSDDEATAERELAATMTPDTNIPDPHMQGIASAHIFNQCLWMNFTEEEEGVYRPRRGPLLYDARPDQGSPVLTGLDRGPWKHGDEIRVLGEGAIQERRSQGWTMPLWLLLAVPRSLVKTAYNMFLNNIYIGLVPLYSDFFYAILSHCQIQDLHLQPNSIFLLSVFAFYYEAFLGVRPSEALFRQFFSLRFTTQG
ncbi:retrotransposon unclassified [Hordeum vulgare]|nr:retrotransposon unclassified [Hordeum vulgare]